MGGDEDLVELGTQQPKDIRSPGVLGTAASSGKGENSIHHGRLSAIETGNAGDTICTQQDAQLQTLLQLTSKESGIRKAGRSHGDEARLCTQLTALFSSPDRICSAFAQEPTKLGAGSQHKGSNVPGVDFKAVRALYQNIRTMDLPPVSDAVIKASEKLLEEYKGLKQTPTSDTALIVDARRIVISWLVLFADPLLLEPENHPLLLILAKALTSLGAAERALAVNILSSLTREDMEEMVATVQQCITVQLYERNLVTEGVQLCTRLLKLLYVANQKSGVLPISFFYNDAVNNKELVDPFHQYAFWKMPERYPFSFCNYPFILDPATKCRILQLDSHAAMKEEFHMAFLNGIFNVAGIFEPYNVMRVRRDHLIHDAISHVQRRKEDLKKQLRVQFVGEDAVDEGGVRKEFFQLVVQELFDPKYGMFSYREQTRQFWFSLQAGELAQIQEEQEERYRKQLQKKAEGKGHMSAAGSMEWSREDVPGTISGEQPSGSGERVDEEGDQFRGGNAPAAPQGGPSGVGAEDLELRREYELVGMLLGLAIYNSCILEVRFPQVVYKKLLGRRLNLSDLESLDKDLAKGLKDLLAFEGDVQEVFQLNFQISVQDIFGETHIIDLKPGGGNIPLTSENRQEYANLFVKFHLDTLIHRPFVAFAKGFKHLVPDHVLKLFEPEELELLICGISELDFDDLEKGAHYTDGYTKDHHTIREFWEIVHGLSETGKRNLLMFVTGCDRAPLRGLGSLKFTISRNGPDSDRLPTAHTCFNHLLLPEYKSKEKLKDRLLTAINNAKGFGLH